MNKSSRTDKDTEMGDTTGANVVRLNQTLLAVHLT
jgi:hypothetical protein